MENTNSSGLLNKLHELMKASRNHKEKATMQIKKVNELITDLQLQLSEVQDEKVTAMIDGKDTKGSDLQENKLLGQLTLLKTKRDNILNSNDEIIRKKMLALVPEIVVAISEENEFKKQQRVEIQKIDEEIAALRQRRVMLDLKRHPYNECSNLINDLEAATHTPKGTVRAAVNHAKGLDKVKNPYFGGDK